MEYTKYTKKELIEIITSVNSILQTAESNAKAESAKFSNNPIRQATFQSGFLIGTIKIALKALKP